MIVISGEVASMIWTTICSIIFFGIGGIMLWGCRTAHSEGDDGYAVAFGFGTVFFISFGVILLLLASGELVIK